MKKSMLLIWTLVCVLLAFSASAEIADELLAEPWVNADVQLTFSADGTGTMTNSQGMTFNTTWTLSGDALSYTFELYGKHTNTLTVRDSEHGTSLTSNAGGSPLYPRSVYDKLAASANEGVSFYTAALGEEINLGFAKMKFTGAEVNTIVGGKSMFMPADDGMKFFCLVGEIENGSGAELNIANVRGEMIFDGQYTYKTDARVVYNDGGYTSLPALMKGKYCIYASIPENLTGSMKECVVHFSFGDGMKQKPGMISDGMFAFEVKIDNATVEKAKEGPQREMAYFEECPILPRPESFTDLNQRGHSSSKSGGKLTRIRYSFGAMLYSRDASADIQKYLDKLAEMGFTVKKQSSTEYTVLDVNKKLTDIKLENGTMVMNLATGNEKLTVQRSKGGAAAAEEAPETAKEYLSLGKKITRHNFTMTLEKTGKASKLYSSIKQTSKRHKYYYSEIGQKFFYLYGSFKNTGSQAVDIRHIYAEIEFDGQYRYTADVIGVKNGASDFLIDITPMTTVGYYVHAQVPEEVLSSYKTCVVRLGFTDDFGIKFTSSGDVPLFDHCDEVFEVKVK